jgi:hypothetical protein
MIGIVRVPSITGLSGGSVKVCSTGTPAPAALVDDRVFDDGKMKNVLLRDG